MTIYLGQLGRLVALHSTPSAEVVPDERYSFQTTIEGGVRSQVRPARGRRKWELQAEGANVSEQAAIMGFITGEWGNGPFVFVSADAPVTNLLTPEAASCAPDAIVTAGVTASGPMLTPEGWAGRSWLNPTPATVMFFGGTCTPVLAGQSVTASAYVLGAGAAVRVYFYDAAGASMSNFTSTVTATAGGAVRSYITRAAPANAASCRVAAVNTSQAVRPALTWTDSLLEWADGQGCPKAVIHGVGRSLMLASREASGGRYSSLSFTVTEVG